MRRALLLLSLLCMTSLSSASLACAPTLAPVYAPSSNAGISASGQPYGPEQIEQAVLRALAVKRWIVLARGPGFVSAEVTSGGHTAEVRVVIGPGGWRIEHVRSSPGLRHGSDLSHGEIIHRRYNHWVRLLDEAIRRELAAVRFVEPAAMAAPVPAPVPVPLPAPVPAPEPAPIPAPAPAPVPAPIPAPAPAPAPAPN